MRLGLGLVSIVVLLATAGCDQLADAVPVNSLTCGDTGAALCRQVARVAIAQMNREATGEITGVTLSTGDCVRLSQSYFHREIATGTTCWRADVVGERSYGGGVVVQRADGSLEAYW